MRMKQESTWIIEYSDLRYSHYFYRVTKFIIINQFFIYIYSILEFLLDYWSIVLRYFSLYMILIGFLLTLFLIIFNHLSLRVWFIYILGLPNFLLIFFYENYINFFFKDFYILKQSYDYKLIKFFFYFFMFQTFHIWFLHLLRIFFFILLVILFSDEFIWWIQIIVFWDYLFNYNFPFIFIYYTTIYFNKYVNNFTVLNKDWSLSYSGYFFFFIISINYYYIIFNITIPVFDESMWYLIEVHLLTVFTYIIK